LRVGPCWLRHFRRGTALLREGKLALRQERKWLRRASVSRLHSNLWWGCSTWPWQLHRAVRQSGDVSGRAACGPRADYNGLLPIRVGATAASLPTLEHFARFKCFFTVLSWRIRVARHPFQNSDSAPCKPFTGRSSIFSGNGDTDRRPRSLEQLPSWMISNGRNFDAKPSTKVPASVCGQPDPPPVPSGRWRSAVQSAALDEPHRLPLLGG
jgi:hypothetical protein